MTILPNLAPRQIAYLMEKGYALPGTKSDRTFSGTAGSLSALALCGT